MPMTIPEVRAELLSLAKNLHKMSPAAARMLIEKHCKELVRRPVEKRAPIKSNKMTPELARKIRQHARANPEKRQVEIGRYFGVNQGRVSEALYGKRGDA